MFRDKPGHSDLKNVLDYIPILSIEPNICGSEKGPKITSSYTRKIVKYQVYNLCVIPFSLLPFE